MITKYNTNHKPNDKEIKEISKTELPSNLIKELEANAIKKIIIRPKSYIKHNVISEIFKENKDWKERITFEAIAIL